MSYNKQTSPKESSILNPAAISHVSLGMTSCMSLKVVKILTSPPLPTEMDGKPISLPRKKMFESLWSLNVQRYCELHHQIPLLRIRFNSGDVRVDRTRKCNHRCTLVDKIHPMTTASLITPVLWVALKPSSPSLSTHFSFPFQQQTPSSGG